MTTDWRMILITSETSEVPGHIGRTPEEAGMVQVTDPKTTQSW